MGTKTSSFERRTLKQNNNLENEHWLQVKIPHMLSYEIVLANLLEENTN